MMTSSIESSWILDLTCIPVDEESERSTTCNLVHTLIMNERCVAADRMDSAMVNQELVENPAGEDVSICMLNRL
jgi:hypothetical protein